LFWQYLHNMIGSVVTASFVMASVGAFYLLSKRSEEYGRTFVRLGVSAGMISTFLMAFPTGDGQGKNIAWHQPPTLAAMEGLFKTEDGAPLAIVGQPDLAADVIREIIGRAGAPRVEHRHQQPPNSLHVVGTHGRLCGRRQTAEWAV
jgi:cytochrome bd-type quinol oxidase subunit 1